MAVTNITLGLVSGAKLFQDTNNANTAQAVVAAAATLYELELDNSANVAQDNFVKLYDTAGAVTVGTTVPEYVFRIRQGAKRSIVIPDGLVFTAGIAIATVTAGGTGGTSSPGSAVVTKLVYA